MSDLKVGDRVVVRGVPKESHEWDVGTVRGFLDSGRVYVHWERAQEHYEELVSCLDKLDAEKLQ